MFESVIVDQNPHWEGALYPEGTAREIQWLPISWQPFSFQLYFFRTRRTGL